MKLGVVGTYYGGSVDPRHARMLSELHRAGIAVAEVHGSPYPEMARAEAMRAALEDEIDVMVFADQNVWAHNKDILAIAELADKISGLVIPPGPAGRAFETKNYSTLAFAAVSREVLQELAANDDRNYTNSCIDTGFGKLARPFCSPFQSDGSLLIPNMLPTEDEAFVTRIKRIGLPVVEASAHFTLLSEPKYSESIVNPEPRQGVPRYAVCVPSFGPLMHEQYRALGELERYGMTIIRVHNCPYLDIARSRLTKLTQLLGLDGVFFVDHDIVFRPEDVETLIKHAEAEQAIVGAAYCMRKSAHAVIGAIECKEGDLIPFFESGGLYPALYTGLGFTAIPMGIFNELDEKLPVLRSTYLSRQPANAPDDWNVRPYFALEISGSFYCGEDVSFCNRVQGLNVEQLGQEDWKVERTGPEKRIYIDTRIRIFHRGLYDYGLEDAGIVVPRVSRLEFQAFDTKARARARLIEAHELPADLKRRSLEAHGLFKERGFDTVESLEKMADDIEKEVGHASA